MTKMDAIGRLAGGVGMTSKPVAASSAIPNSCCRLDDGRRSMAISKRLNARETLRPI